MDTENFIVSRQEILERLERRRGANTEIKLPSWARVALSFATSGGLLGRFLEVALPLALPFLMKRQIPTFGRLVQRLFSPKY